jgi:Fe-S cluster assembly scaffold IscU
MAYSNKVIDHYEHPRNVGSLDKSDDNVGTGIVGAPACGDVMKLQIKVENGVITDAKFKTYGCGSAIASSSLVTEWVKGMSIDKAMTIKNSDIAEELSLPPVKIHCSVLAEDAIKAAIRDYQLKHGITDTTARVAPPKHEPPLHDARRARHVRRLQSARRSARHRPRPRADRHLARRQGHARAAGPPRHPQASIRLGIRGGGCTGYSYLFEFDDRDPRASDHVITKDGVRVVVDPKSMILLKGTEVDFETGIRGHGFKFHQPQHQGLLRLRRVHHLLKHLLTLRTGPQGQP